MFRDYNNNEICADIMSCGVQKGYKDGNHCDVKDGWLRVRCIVG